MLLQHHEVAGLPDGLGRLLSTPGMTDVVINDDRDVWVDRGGGMERADISIDGDVRRIAVQLAGMCGKRLDEASPIVDGVLPNGVRLHAVLAPICQSPAVISLRVSNQTHINLDQLRHRCMMDASVAALLDAMVRARLSMFISGATGSGKTTLLSALLSRVEATQRIICIEEVSELAPDHPHVVHLQERKPNIQGRGHVSMSELVRAAMRMRPDRIVLGECRGEEVKDVLSAMNTGHDGSCATIHANTAVDVPARLVALGALAGLSREAISAQAVAAIDVVIHCDRRLDSHGTMRRWISQIAVPVMDGGLLTMRPALSVDINGTTVSDDGMDVIDRVCSTRGVVRMGQ